MDPVRDISSTALRGRISYIEKHRVSLKLVVSLCRTQECSKLRLRLRQLRLITTTLLHTREIVMQAKSTASTRNGYAADFTPNNIIR
jgi:hypothetical protein